ncbi:MAG: transcriptional repressor [FCB group bacterium]|nr:transcriptional repressor [FCB group bacterium]
MDKEQLKENFASALKQENLKRTPQRFAILEELVSSDEHRECTDIYFALRNQGISVSRATVYRTMDILVKYDFARRLDIGDGIARYESKVGISHHDHLICLECGKIIEFLNRDIESLQQSICNDFDFDMIRHTHQIFGVCPDCKSK